MAKPLTEIAAKSPAFAGELERLRREGSRDEPMVLERVSPAAYSFVAAMVAAASDQPRRVWIVADALPVQERLAAEWPLWQGPQAVFVPEQEIHINNGISDPDLAAERLEALRAISGPAKETQAVIVTAAALQQPAPSFAAGAGFSLTLNVGSEYPLDDVCTALTDHEFERVDQVTGRGEWSLRGGILDVFPLQSAWPLRVEFFGDEVESIRAFDIDSQLSFKKLESADLVLDEPPADRPLGEWITGADWVVSLPGCGVPGHVLVYELPPDRDEVLPDIDTVNAGDNSAIFGTPLGSFETGDFVMQEARRQLAGMELRKWREQKWRVVMFFPHEGEKSRFEEICGEDDAWSGVQSRDGDLPLGFSIPGAKLAVLSAAEIFGRYSTPRSRKQDDRTDRMRRERAQAPLREIEEGDFVIHASHGLGKFVGIVRDTQSGEEEIHIKYADGVLLRIPLQQSHLVSKYIGLGARTPELSKLGDARWRRACQAAEKAVQDYAAQLLEVQAERESNSGYAHPADSGWMWQFESSFPYRETPDQLRAISQTKADMESGRPMDRLICGDVGFGKTEVAIRAAFKCVTGGRQAAILAPTTVLAAQHYRTFRTRMSEYPVRIELLSRFTPPKKVKEIVAGIADGSVDIVIGTHRVISKDVTYKNLGLAVIDEQHKFGVEQRERFIASGVNPDVLVMTATPIPRTLTLTLYGDLEVSIIDELPANRGEISTALRNPDNMKRIISFMSKEIDAGRQVYIVSPLVEDSDSRKQASATSELNRWKELFPQRRVGLLHGRMPAADKDEVMQAFSKGQLDILVATTVVEVGVDVPNANIMIINDADTFGLSQLHQLRGRIGRGEHKSYCILLSRAKPGEPGREKLEVLCRTLNGFEIAEEDFRLRGPGDVLGTAQSGLGAIEFTEWLGDMRLIHRANRDAAAILDADPELKQPRHAPLRELVQFEEENGVTC